MTHKVVWTVLLYFSVVPVALIATIVYRILRPRIQRACVRRQLQLRLRDVGVGRRRRPHPPFRRPKGMPRKPGPGTKKKRR